MLRHYKQHEGGVKVYTHELLPRLFEYGSRHSFLLMYRDRDLLGTYGAFENVEEVAAPLPMQLLWDQLSVPWLARRRALDVIFNPKFTVPFFAAAQKVFVLHGPGWLVIPEAFPWYDRWYAKLVVPFYCRRADMMIATSRTAGDDTARFAAADPKKIVPVYNGLDGDTFRVIRQSEKLEAVRQKYGLPRPFILWAGQIYPPKNVSRLLRAFALLVHEIPHVLIMAGEPRKPRRAWQELERLIDELDIGGRVLFTGWVPQEDLAAFYNLADLFAFPSLYEGFGIPLLEAMGCGCPIVTSRTGSAPEIVEDAAWLVDPNVTRDIAAGIRNVLSNEGLREALVERGLRRVRDFSWDRCARETLLALESLGGGAKCPPRGPAKEAKTA